MRKSKDNLCQIRCILRERDGKRQRVREGERGRGGRERERDEISDEKGTVCEKCRSV